MPSADAHELRTTTAQRRQVIATSKKTRQPARPSAAKRTQNSTSAPGVVGAATPFRRVPDALRFKRVASLREFVVAIEEAGATRGQLWFRGISQESYELVPSLYRTASGRPEEELKRIEEQLNRRFRDRSMPHGPQGRDETSDTTDLQSWWRLFTMQHYGTPTRLLDWSENALTALCFALFGAPLAPQQDAVLWILDPCEWNNIGNANNMRPLSVDEHGAGPYAPLPSSNQHVAATWPLAIYGMHNSPRIISQQGTFTVFAPGKPMSMEQHALSNIQRGTNALKAVIVESAAIHSIAASLRKLGFSHSNLFPDLHGLATDLKKEFGY